MKISWKYTAFMSLIVSSLILESCCRPSVDSHSREKRQAVVQDRQFIGGLSTLGALIQPILFMIGMANFMGRIPTFFNRMRDRFSSTLAGTGAPAGAGRKRRSVGEGSIEDDDTFDKVVRVLRLLSEAEEKYTSQN